jgi:neutral amino acid transport system ATP-binding protein
MADAPLLAVEGLAKHYGGVRAVDGATFDVPAGTITALIGPNGAGKSSAFNLISGFESPDAGSVRLDGAVVTGLAPYQLPRRGLVRTFQLTKALEGLSVMDNMLVAAPHNPGDALLGAVFRIPSWRKRLRDAREQAAQLLEELSLTHLTDDYAGTLSGGQRKLLELGRALMLEPRLLLLDEPLAGVNPTLRARIMEQVERLRAERGMTFLIVEHDLQVILARAHKVIVMADGRVIAAGTPAEVRNDSRVVDAYLGVASATQPPNTKGIT